jgi:uncharacterized protein
LALTLAISNPLASGNTMSYIISTRIAWDFSKAEENFKKHGVSFEEAATVLFSSDALRFEDDHHDEERFISIGHSALERILMVVYCYRFEDEIRIISARKATRKERVQYEEGI